MSWSLRHVALVLGALMVAACGPAETAGDTEPLADQPTSTDDAEEVSEDEQVTFYEGESIEILVPFSPGGGTDTQARFYAPFLSEKIPGEPQIQVTNLPGGGSITGSNEFALRREPDGMTLLMTGGSTNMGYLFRDPAIQFDFNAMTPVVGFPTGAALYVSPSTGVSEPTDLLNPEEPLTYAGISLTGTDIVPLLSWEVLGVDVQVVMGYEGRGAARLAFEQGESNIDNQTTSAFLANVEPMIEAGDAVPLYSFGQLDESGEVGPDPGFPDLPTTRDVYESIHGEAPSGPAWEAYKAALGAGYTINSPVWMHEDSPPVAVEAVKSGFQSMASDPEYLAAAEEVTGGYEPIVGDAALQGALGPVLSVEDSTYEWLTEWLTDEYGWEGLED